MQNHEKITIRKWIPHQGLNAAAAKLGCSPTQLHFVLRGERTPNPELAGRLKAAGIKYKTKKNRR